MTDGHSDSESPITAGSFVAHRDTAERYFNFARIEARGSSPLYGELAAGVSRDQELLTLLQRVPPAKRQPNLLFAAVLYLGGVQPNYPAFRRFVLERQDAILAVLHERSTQTNEVGRCAVLLPLLARIPGPLALLEVGASAGLCLLPDRYAYRYDDGPLLGDPASPVHLACATHGPVPIPAALPGVVWRRGIDLTPVDVRVDDQVRWLECCVWPDQPERLARLRAAVAVTRHDPPEIMGGDLFDLLPTAVEAAPPDATLVVFHSAVLAYLTPERRRAFAALMTGRPWIWISNEAPGMVEALWGDRPRPHRNIFVLGMGAERIIGFTHPHGRWVEWLAP